MKNFESHFKFNKQERSGIFFLLLVIIVLQGTYYFMKAEPFEATSMLAVNTLEQSRLDSLKSLEKDAKRIFSFNPNYIDDHKGYTLGMSTEELDRLFAFRKAGSFVNSSKEFQVVTQISDSLLAAISPFFKFPAWKLHGPKTEGQPKKANTVVKDLNSATAEDLRRVYGIGEVLSNRIIKFRDRLGGFLVNEQLYDVYGLEPEVIKRALDHFQVMTPPEITKININTAEAGELSNIAYISPILAEQIVAHRKAHGAFTSLNELTGVKAFPADRIERIKLYLTL